MKRLFAIGFVWAGCALAWMILGSTLAVRSSESGSNMEGGVYELWGPPTVQSPPSAWQYHAEGSVPARIEGSAIDVDLDLEHRKRGLKWFATYEVDFRAEYRFVNTDASPREIHVSFPLSSEAMGYDNFLVTRVEDGSLVDFEISESMASWVASVDARQSVTFRVSYATRGTGRWSYAMVTDDTRVRDFRLTLRTNFEEVDFPLGSLSPTAHAPVDGGWEGVWEFESLISNAPIGIALPERLNPGPLAAKITFFAPVCLLFFFFLISIVAAARSIDLHPMHYFFMGAAFFAFHLLFAYLVDHVSIGLAFSLSALTSVFLVVSYARLFTGMRFALRVVGAAQLFYLVLFSYTFFLEGFTGLAVTVGAILTLFVMMQLTGTMDWSLWGQKKLPEGEDAAEGKMQELPRYPEPLMAKPPEVF